MVNLIIDITTYTAIKLESKTYIFESEFIVNQPPSPVNELVQLSYVLPLQSLHFLPNKLYNKLMQEHIDWYKNDCKFVWAYCRYFWESHVIMPEINIDELEEFIKNNF